MVPRVQAADTTGNLSDPATADWFKTNMAEADMIFGGLCAVLVVVVGVWLQRRGRIESSPA